MENIQKLLDENRELKESLRRFTDECERLTEDLKECEREIIEKDRQMSRLYGMVEAFEICVKGRK